MSPKIKTLLAPLDQGKYLPVSRSVLQVWKILNGVTPNDIRMKFYSESSRRGTIAIIPPLVKGYSQRNQSLYDGSFTVLGARLWNVIPSDIKSLKTFLAFKEKLSRFLDTFLTTPCTGILLHKL